VASPWKEELGVERLYESTALPPPHPLTQRVPHAAALAKPNQHWEVVSAPWIAEVA